MGSSYSKYESVNDITKVPYEQRSQRLYLRVFDNALRTYNRDSINHMIDNEGLFLQGRFINAVSDNRYRLLPSVNAPCATHEDQYYQTLFLRLIQAGFQAEAIKLRRFVGIPLSECFSQISFCVDSVPPDRESLEDVFRKNGIELLKEPYYCHIRSLGYLKSIFAVAVNTESLDLVKDLLHGVSKEDLQGNQENVVRNLFNLADKLWRKGKIGLSSQFEFAALDIIKMFNKENLGPRVFTEACFYGLSNVATYIIDNCYLLLEHLNINERNPHENGLMYCVDKDMSNVFGRDMSNVFGKIMNRFYHNVTVKSNAYLAWVGTQIKEKPNFCQFFNQHVKISD